MTSLQLKMGRLHPDLYLLAPALPTKLVCQAFVLFHFRSVLNYADTPPESPVERLSATRSAQEGEQNFDNLEW